MEILTLSQFITSKFNNYSTVIDVAKDCKHFQVSLENNGTSAWNSKEDENFYVVSFLLDNAFYTATYTCDSKSLIGLNIRIVLSDNDF